MHAVERLLKHMLLVTVLNRKYKEEKIKLERVMGVASLDLLSLASRRSSHMPKISQGHPHSVHKVKIYKVGAGDGGRTHDLLLGKQAF